MIPALSWQLQAADPQIGEATLTGELLSVTNTVESIPARMRPWAANEHRNMAFLGTSAS